MAEVGVPPKRARRRSVQSSLTALPSAILTTHISPFLGARERARVRSTSRVLRQDILPYAGPKEPSFIVALDGDIVGVYTLSHIPQVLDDITNGRWNTVLGAASWEASSLRFTAVVGTNQPPLHLPDEENVVAFDVIPVVPWAGAAAAGTGSEFVDFSRKQFDDFTVDEVLAILHETADKLAIAARRQQGGSVA